MKYLLSAIAMMFALSTSSVYAEATVKKVCKTDEKTKKEVCKDVKVHKKAEKVTTGSPTDPEPKKDTKKK
jgi:uncharacterized protein YcfJ